MKETELMFEILDRIMNLDIGQRGVDKLYGPARARSTEPLCAAAARRLSGTRVGDCIVLITGSLTRPWVSMNIGETDGPVGVAALARALSYGFNAIPVVVTDTSLIEPISETLRASGQAIASLAEAKRATSNKRFCSVAVVLGFPLEDIEARKEAQRIISEFRPTAVIAVERAGMTPKGTYHNMLGQDYSEGRARIDYLVEKPRPPEFQRSGWAMEAMRSGWELSRKPSISTFPMVRFCVRNCRQTFYCLLVYRTGGVMRSRLRSQ